MREVAFGEKSGAPVALALGFFDSVHLGHRKLLQRAEEIAKIRGIWCAAMTFKNNPFETMGKKTKLIYSYEERAMLFEKLGIDIVCVALFDDNFMRMSADDFLAILADTFDLKHVVCGYDFRFGKEREGDVKKLCQFCRSSGIGLDVIEKAVHNGKKVSSTLIREYLSKGEIEKANELLAEPYFMMGEVIHGRKVGSKLLFPTINIELDCQKLKIKQGVYFTLTTIDGIQYRSVTNFGQKPTFGLKDFEVETYIIGYDGDLYGKRVAISFIKKLRDTAKFADAKALKEQIYKDIEKAKAIPIDRLA